MKRPIDIYTAEEFDRMLRACPKKTPLGLRNRAMLAMLWGAGLRISELCCLMPSDVNDDGGINVRSGKGAKQRFCAIDQQNLAIVSAWISCRTAPRDVPLFCTVAMGLHKPMTRHSAWHIIRRIAKRAGIAKRVHPHGFRHSMTARLMKQGVKINVLQRLLGHSNAATTSRYAAHVSPQELIEAINPPQTSVIEINGKRYRVVEEAA